MKRAANKGNVQRWSLIKEPGAEQPIPKLYRDVLVAAANHILERGVPRISLFKGGSECVSFILVIFIVGR